MENGIQNQKIYRNIDLSKSSSEYINHPVRTNGEILKYFGNFTQDYWDDGITWKQSYDDEETHGWQYDIKQDTCRVPGGILGSYIYLKQESIYRAHPQL